MEALGGCARIAGLEFTQSVFGSWRAGKLVGRDARTRLLASGDATSQNIILVELWNEINEYFT